MSTTTPHQQLVQALNVQVKLDLLQMVPPTRCQSVFQADSPIIYIVYVLLYIYIPRNSKVCIGSIYFRAAIIVESASLKYVSMHIPTAHHDWNDA